MSGISGISGFGGVDPSAWIGMNAVNSIATTSPSAVGTAPGTTAIESLALSTSLQALVETIRTFGTTEVLLALLLAARKDHCPSHDLFSANLLSGLALAGFLSQRILLPSFEAPASPVSGASINMMG